jgi:UDP-GlcNAc:undecaprenyl-phosphate GlcNAc-1-phosphate transferase
MIVLISATGFTALMAGLLLAFFLRPLAIHFGIVDKPSFRKRHHGDIPLIGGPLILIITLVGVSLSPTSVPPGLLGAAILIVLLGVLDDKFDVPAKLKLFGQICAACLAAILDQSIINDIGIFQDGFADPSFTLLHLGLCVLAIVVGVNALNLIDGIDGLAASLVLVIVLHANLAFWIFGETLPTGIVTSSSVLAGALCSFLVYNLGLFKNKKIFLGDSGSMLVGLYVAVMMIEISQPSAANTGVTIPATLCLWLIAVPVSDMVTTFLGRLLKGKSPFAPDRSHLHLKLKDLGYSKWRVLLIILASAMAIFWLGAMITLLFGETISFITFCVYFALHSLTVFRLGRARQKLVSEQAS